jgi:hypothetical protein
MGPMALLPSEGKRAVDFLSLLKLHRPRLGLNPRTLGPVASTLTTRLSRTNLSLSYQYGQLQILKAARQILIQILNHVFYHEL